MFSANNSKTKNIVIVFIFVLFVFILSEVIAYGVMTSFGKVEVRNVNIENFNGLNVRGKLYRPLGVTSKDPAPGVLYLHGYQNNRETSDPYAIELSRRGFVVLVIDTLGRGNSDNQFSEDEAGFDDTYGGNSAFEYLRGLSFVDSDRCGIGGHSLGGEMAYNIALENRDVRALVFSGFAWDNRANYNEPVNMLMIFGKYDEYRKRMTHVSNFEKEWMQSIPVSSAITDKNPQFDLTYGSFSQGNARKVHLTNTTHVGECFNRGAIAEAIGWYSKALKLPVELNVNSQIWRVKEACSLIAMLSAFFSIIPFLMLLLRTNFFGRLAGTPGSLYVCTKRDFIKGVTTNGILSLLYLPLILVIFGVHVYLFPIDGIFPMMMVNGIVFWFIVINCIGFILFRKWMRKTMPKRAELTYSELGIGLRDKGGLGYLFRTFFLAVIVFSYVYVLEAGFEYFLLIDFRYKFPYASDFTAFRFLMFLEYFVLFLLGYIYFNIFLQAQLRFKPIGGFIKNTFFVSVRNIIIVIAPLLIILAVQYFPIFLGGNVPINGPGGALIGFIINIEHMCLLLCIMIILSTTAYNLTGKIYLGAILNALLVAWMFTSSSVIAPLPV